MDEEEQVFKRLGRTPITSVMSELFEQRLLVYDYQTQRISLVICKQLEDICRKHGWDIEELTDTTNEK